MEAPDVISVLAGGIKQNTSGRWISTDLTIEDNKLGAPGGKLRILAAAALAERYPAALVETGGGKGFDVPKDYPGGRPLLAEILRDELLEYGVPENRMVLEENSNSTYEELQELEKLIAERSWKHVALITNQYHLARLKGIIGAKFSHIDKILHPVSAEDILTEADPARWEEVVKIAYASPYMLERIAKEKQGVEQIQQGTYVFR